MSNDKKQLDLTDVMKPIPMAEVIDRSQPAPGGNMVFTSGQGYKGAPAGNIMFYTGDGKECLRFEPGGDVYVRGEKVDSNREIWLRFRDWLLAANVVPSTTLPVRARLDAGPEVSGGGQ